MAPSSRNKTIKKAFFDKKKEISMEDIKDAVKKALEQEEINEKIQELADMIKENGKEKTESRNRNYRRKYYRRRRYYEALAGIDYDYRLYGLKEIAQSIADKVSSFLNTVKEYILEKPAKALFKILKSVADTLSKENISNAIEKIKTKKNAIIDESSRLMYQFLKKFGFIKIVTKITKDEKKSEKIIKNVFIFIMDFLLMVLETVGLFYFFLFITKRLDFLHGTIHFIAHEIVAHLFTAIGATSFMWPTILSVLAIMALTVILTKIAAYLLEGSLKHKEHSNAKKAVFSDESGEIEDIIEAFEEFDKVIASSGKALKDLEDELEEIEEAEIELEEAIEDDDRGSEEKDKIEEIKEEYIKEIIDGVKQG